MEYTELKKYRELDIKEIEEMWKTNTRPTVLYLHTPFCKFGNCKYCLHKGYPMKEDSNIVKDFFENYMKMMLDKYTNIINSQDIKMVSFGGGTPNFLPPKEIDTYLNYLFNKFPKLIDLPKLIELHPAYVTKELLDVLKKYEFTTTIFCVQTMSDKVLKEQNRNKAVNLEKNVNYAKECGFNIGFDLITCWYNDDNEDWNILSNDMDILSKLEPDELTISFLYQHKYFGDDFDAVKQHRKLSDLVREKFPLYINPENSIDYRTSVVPIRFFKWDKKAKPDFDIYQNSLMDISWPGDFGYSTIGIGSYKNQDKTVYSIIGPRYSILEYNDGDMVPHFYLEKDYDFWESAHEAIDKIKDMYDGNEFPVGGMIMLENICVDKNNGNFLDYFKQDGCKKYIISDNICREI